MNKKENSEMNKKEVKNSGEKSFFYVLFFLGFLLFVFLVWVFMSSAANKLEYNNVKFEKIMEGNLEFYKTTVEVLDKKTLKIREFSFFLRNSPEELQKIPFNGEIVSDDLVVLNSTSGFNCDGDGVIAIANLKQLYEVDGSIVIRNESATCGKDYLFINLVEGNETRIDQEGSCYTISINNCEIIAGTERLMLENLAEWNKEDN